MTIYLSALGWVNDLPAGNRLRWHFPHAELSPGSGYPRLPQVVLVERAPLNLRFVSSRLSPSPYPPAWWDLLGSPTVGGLLLADEYKLPAPAQAVAFVWRGSDARIAFHNTQTSALEALRTVTDGASVYVEGQSIDTIAVLGTGGTLENLRILDLFRDRQLDWERVAEIAVEKSLDAELDIVAKRYSQPVTLTKDQWAELVHTAQRARASSPADAIAGEPTAWEMLELLLGLRWEVALLCGFAYCDGPGAAGCELDSLLARPLETPDHTGYAYRIRNGDNGETSNLVIVVPAIAKELGVPDAPMYIGAEVRLPEPVSPQLLEPVPVNPTIAVFKPLPVLEERFQVRLTQLTRQSDQRAHGVEIEEIVTASPTVGSRELRRTFYNRSRRPEDPQLAYSSARSFDVDFPDVLLQSRARAIDAWDRVSGYSAWSPQAPLTLRHEPLPPPFESAAYESGTARITRRAASAGEPDWKPDPLVRRAGGRLILYRQSAAPRRADAVFGGAIPAGDGVYRSSVTGVNGLPDFIGGIFSTGGVTENVIAVDGSDILFRSSANAGASSTSFDSGPGRLVQDLKHPSLWVQVADFPAENLPQVLVFNDPLPPPAAVSVVTYMARLAYYGRSGPPGGVVRAVRQPDIPAIPPPFTAELLGIDFFHRTLLKLRFTIPTASGRYTVWWCDGTATPEELARRGAPGTHQAQVAQSGLHLYETLALPIPQHVDRLITIGVQQVGEGAVSSFAVIPFMLPALHG
ncbi:hypothetical protein [Paenibacillus nasutitermitis]|uniref:Uncharacterized protein n=1 Tax=Paenibacillus nasutitermitis TaxID=1652958 RepID=A0A916ZDK9_9BACL|nr:hypothetical protein [Paenibacillus nasutitermitis]GGD90082.1 hypothetical protein GCM10010911_55890 [Paenibacillus nasutitermitis]